MSSDEELRLIHHLAPVGLLTLDPKGMVRQANQTACELMGMRQPVCRVAPLAAYVDAGSCEELFAHIGRVFRGAREASPPLRFRRRDGQINWIQLHSRLHTPPGNSSPMCFSALLDVTKQRRAEQAIRHSEQSFRELLAQLPDGVVVLSGQVLEYANRRFARFVGERNPERLVGCGIVDYVHREDLANFRSWVSRMADVTCQERTAEFQLMPSGRREAILAEFTAIPMVLSGRLVTVLLVRDVTHARRMRADLEQANRLATVGVLAAGVAHEINNPLNYIMLNLEAARHDIEMQQPEDVDERLATALHGTERVRDIVKSLNSFARIDARPSRIHVHEFIQKASAMAAAELRSRARLELNLDQNLEVVGVEGRLCQVILNLLVNAAHAVDDGRAEDNEIRVTTEAQGDRVHITISDTGCGIPPEHVPKIFDPFYTTKAPGEGSGLGLSLCRNYICSHGGEIRVVSEPGKGTQFRIELPLAPAKEGEQGEKLESPLEPTPSEDCVTLAPARARALRRTGPGRHYRLLVVDDEELIRNVLEAVLKDDYQVTCASSGDEALELLKTENDFDVILCDLMMAHGSGMELYDTLRQRTPELCERIVFMTGGAHTEESSNFLEQVNPRVAFKPLSRDEVLAVVAETLAEDEAIPVFGGNG